MPRKRKAPNEKVAPRKIYASDPVWKNIEEIAVVAGYRNASQYLLALHTRGDGRPAGHSLILAQLQHFDRLHGVLTRIAHRIEAAAPHTPDTARILAELFCLERRLMEMRPGRGDGS